MSEDTEPKAGAASPPPEAKEDKPKRPRKPRGRPIALESELEEFFTMLGAGVMMLDQFDGLVLVSQAGENAKALAKLANKNARVKKALEGMMQISSMGAVVGVIGATAVPILMHHQVIPPSLPMPDEWMEPPERIQFKEEVERQMQSRNGGNGAGPAAPPPGS